VRKAHKKNGKVSALKTSSQSRAASLLAKVQNEKRIENNRDRGSGRARGDFRNSRSLQIRITRKKKEA